MPARGRKRLHSKMPWGCGWKRAKDLPDDRRYGLPLDKWDPDHPALLDTAQVKPSARALRTDSDPDAWYGRSEPDGTPYSHNQYAERYHRPGTAEKPDVNWPPNEGAVRGTKLDYHGAYKFIRDFGDRMDRLGQPNGKFMGLMEDGVSSSYEARAIHYTSLCEELLTYRLIPEKFPKEWTIRVMDTAPALGQPGGSLGLKFFDEDDTELYVGGLFDKGALQHDR